MVYLSEIANPARVNTSLNILLIDDDEDDRELFQFALEDLSHNVDFLGLPSGRSALDKLEAQAISPDFIFLDLNMPGMSGRECLSILKQDHRFSAIPVVIFSTSSDPTDIKVTKELGAMDFITKPSKTSELTAILNRFILKNTHTHNT